jgi:anti-sigma factor RsiW
VEIVTDYLSGALPPDERARLEQHLVVCDACTRYVEQMRASARLVGKLREEDVSREMASALGAVFRRWKQGGRP